MNHHQLKQSFHLLKYYADDFWFVSVVPISFQDLIFVKKFGSSLSLKFAELKDRFMQSITQRKEQTAVQDLRKAAKIEILDKDLDASLKAFRGSFSGQQQK